VTQILEDAQSLYSVEASLTFAVRDGGTPVSVPSRPGEGEGRYEGDHETRQVEITNAWPMADELSLDREGFQLVHHHTDVDFYDDAERTTTYERQIEDLVKQTTGAKRVIVFDHTLRAGDKGTRTERAVREPVQMVHNDYTDRSARQRLRDLVGDEEAEELMKGRFAIMNVWRGNRQTIEDMPLAFADARSIDPADLIPVERRSEDRIGEIQHLVHNPNQRWYYLPQIGPDEALLIKCFDSDNTKAKLTAHTAFADPTSRADAPARESIESRTFVFY
jgi:hypothetical protein